MEVAQQITLQERNPVDRVAIYRHLQPDGVRACRKVVFLEPWKKVTCPVCGKTWEFELYKDTTAGNVHSFQYIITPDLVAYVPIPVGETIENGG